MEEKELIKLAKEGNKDCLDLLMNNYKGLVKSISQKYFIIGADENDVIQEGMIGLFNAYENFDETKNVQFKTFAYLCINRQIITAIKKAYKHNNSDLLDDINVNIINQNSKTFSPEDNIICEEDYKNMLKEINDNLSNKEQLILQEFLSNKSYDEIATKLNTSKKSVDNALVRIRNKLKYLNK